MPPPDLSIHPLGCKRHISKGHRFNAKKEDAGKYFSTKIFSFHTKCPNKGCSQKFVIKTDHKNSTYDYAEGIRKMEQDYETVDDDRVIKLATDETKEKLACDAMFKLEYDNEKKAKAESAKEQISSLIDLNDAVVKQDYNVNSKLRRRNRQIRQKEKSMLKLGNSIGLSVPLLESNETDRIGAIGAKFRPRHDGTFGASERSSMISIQEQSIFSKYECVKGSGVSSGKRKNTSSSKSDGSEKDNSMISCGKESALQKQARLMIKIGGYEKGGITKDQCNVTGVLNVNSKSKRLKTGEYDDEEEDNLQVSSGKNRNERNGNGLTLLSSMYDDVSD